LLGGKKEDRLGGRRIRGSPKSPSTGKGDLHGKFDRKPERSATAVKERDEGRGGKKPKEKGEAIFIRVAAKYLSLVDYLY